MRSIRDRRPRLGLRVAPRATITPEVALGAGAAVPMPSAFERLDAPPVFITGHARSGTSWTLDLFDRQPDVCAVFESWLLTQTSGITAVLSQPQWHPDYYASRLETIGTPHAAVQLLDYETALRELGELAASWLMRQARPEHRFLVEKGPLDMAAAAALFPAARFVHVIRDGRDVARSVAAGARSWAPAMRGGAMRDHAAEWRRIVKEIRSHRVALGDRYHEVRFEDLQRDFVPTVRRLFRFAGVPDDDAAIERARTGTDLLGYSSGARESGFRGRGSVGGWRGSFGVRDAFVFDRAAGDLLIELGYETSRAWIADVALRRVRRSRS